MKFVGLSGALTGHKTSHMVFKVLHAAKLQNQDIEIELIVVIGTPIYQASISGSLKNLLDFLPERAFRDKIVGFISTAGSDKYFLVAEYHLRPIIQFLGGVVPSRNVFVPDSSFNVESEIDDDLIDRRIMKFSEEFLKLSKK
ncbi:NADPH-dependent FMN reductase [Caldibacillus thermoamylovorans]